MGFYDNYNFEGLKFLSHIKENPTVAEPCTEFLQAVKFMKTPPPETLRSLKLA